MPVEARARRIRGRRFPWMRLTIATGCGVALFALFLVPAFAPWFLRFEHWTADWRTAFFSQRLSAPHPKIAVVTINDATLKDLPSSPVDRGLLARIIAAIDGGGARAIGLDIYFLKKTDPERDQALIDAMRNAKAEIVLGAIDERGELEPFQREFQTTFLARTGRPAGYLNLRHERDDVVRYVAAPAPGSAYPESFARLLAKTAGSTEEDRGRAIPWLLPPRSGEDAFLKIPAQDLFDTMGKETAAALKDRIVLIGGDFPFRDRHRTPLSVLSGEGVAGVLIHAQIIDGLLDPARTLSELRPRPATLLLIVLTAAGFAFGWSLWQSTFIGFLAWSFATGLLLAVDAVVFMELHLLLPFTLAFFAWFAAVTAGREAHFVANWLLENRDASKRVVES